MPSKTPNHIAIILDGNRRYAKKLGLQPWKGHEFGLKKLEELFRWCQEIGVKELTLYTFSTENFNRTKREISYLFGLFKNEINKIRERKEGVFRDKIRFRFIGRLHLFDREMQEAMAEITEKTKDNEKFTVNFAMAYGGRQEITDAVKAIIKKIQDKKLNPDKIDENAIASHLYLQSEPEIVIRPGGEIRTSNFLIWQSVYSEWIFVDKLWPEFTKEDLIQCIDEFNRRERRFGR